MKHLLKIKPISANKMYYRNKRKTQDYSDFQEGVSHIINPSKSPLQWPFTSPVELKVKVGYSNILSDIDNCLKGLIDTYASIYSGFNDRTVFKITVEKEIVPKGESYLDIEWKEYQWPIKTNSTE